MDRIKKLFGSINKWHLAYTGLLFFNNFAYVSEKETSLLELTQSQMIHCRASA